MMRDSGMIFAGTVLKVQQGSGSASPAIPVTRITFRVEQAFRGVRAGQVFTMTEWAGLWQNRERYHVGEKVLLFLYPKSKLGLTSPVGAMGRFPVDSRGRVSLQANDRGALPVEVFPVREAVARIRSQARP